MIAFRFVTAPQPDDAKACRLEATNVLMMPTCGMAFQSAAPLLLKRHDIVRTRVARRGRCEIHRVCMQANGARGSGSGSGFGAFLQRSDDVIHKLPADDVPCACASDKSYGQCCRKFHVAQTLPRLAVELLRSRYSAYAYRLPSYIMATTHKSTAEFDRRKWKTEIMNFCKRYQFVGGVDVIEQSMTGPTSTTILFRYVYAKRDSVIASS